MRKKFALLVASFSLLAGVVTVVNPAEATSSAPAVVQTAQALPADVSGFKFWSASGLQSPPGVCIDGSEINGAYYRVAYIAQQWNLRVGNTDIFALNYEDDCAAAGYPPSRRMVVGSYSNPSITSCATWTNTYVSQYHGFGRWTSGPGAYINFGSPNCINSQTHRDHAVSSAIGVLLGLEVLNGAGWNSRVMNITSFSWNNVPLPDQASGDTLYRIYSGYYCDPVAPC